MGIHLSFIPYLIVGNLVVGWVAGMDLDSPITGTFLDVLTKTIHLNDKTGCEVQTANQTKPYFFGITDLKCLNVEVRLRKNGYDVNELRKKFPTLIGKRSVSMTKHQREKRSSPSRNALRPVHRWIYYDGYFIEFGAGSGNIGNYQEQKATNLTIYSALNSGINESVEATNDEESLSNANMQTLYPKNGDLCDAKMESEVAGYSSVSLDCIYKCARSYVSKYGKYHLIKNNCHLFANRVSEILCTGVCPEWCK